MQTSKSTAMRPLPPAIDGRVPVLGFAAFSGTGKTTLLAELIPLLRERGLRLGVIKHAHHRFDIDIPGKDSHRLRQAGAERVLIGSAQRWALMVERPQPADPVLADLLAAFPIEGLDLVLVEGFKHERFAKIELHRAALGHPLLYPADDTVIALATDDAPPATCPVPVLDLNRPDAIAAYIVDVFLTGQATSD